MAKKKPVRKTKTARQIVAEQMPEVRVIERPPAADAGAAAAQADSVGPSLDEMKKSSGGTVTEAAAVKSDEVEIVTVESAKADPRRRGPGPQGAVVSRSEGKIIGHQG